MVPQSTNLALLAPFCGLIASTIGSTADGPALASGCDARKERPCPSQPVIFRAIAELCAAARLNPFNHNEVRADSRTFKPRSGSEQTIRHRLPSVGGIIGVSSPRFVVSHRSANIVGFMLQAATLSDWGRSDLSITLLLEHIKLGYLSPFTTLSSRPYRGLKSAWAITGPPEILLRLLRAHTVPCLRQSFHIPSTALHSRSRDA